ncbi:MAG: methionine--tRNA ligase [Candidatus Micrarchaeota archaeon]|nr:methionine--tRNA ligase [Candidatus Micrarchaeota archaeon]
MSENGKGFYVTTAIPYVNAAPHIGFALELVQADVIARYHRIKGEKVILLTGSDENSIKNVKAAEKQKISTQELVDRNAQAFKDVAKSLNVSYDRFAKSSIKEEHWEGVGKLWELADRNGDIYKKKYSGLYCPECEQFYKENELVGGLCPEHHIKPELIEEENYFFKLSKYQDKIKELLETGKLEVVPSSRKNEVLGFVKEGLDDFSISRSSSRAKGWGIPVPNDQSQIIYVWMDALVLYLTGIGYGKDESMFGQWWPANVHVIGKGIIKFHALYWPAFLLSAKLELPKKVFVHGYITIEGQKISKSLGNVINPLDLLKTYRADEIRYYLIREIPTFQDGDFSESALKDKINKELLGDLGNLVNRVLTLAENSKLDKFTGNGELKTKFNLESIDNKMDALELHHALDEIMEFVRYCNKYVNDKKPWTLQGSDLEGVLYNLLESLRVISILLYPFIPSTSEKIAAKLGMKNEELMLSNCRFRKEFSEKITKGELLFTKV